MTTSPDSLAARTKALGLYSLLEDWPRYRDEPWLEPLLEREEKVRAERSLQRRIQRCRIGPFKPMADFDYDWPTQIDRDQVEDLFTLDWLDSAANVVLLGPDCRPQFVEAVQLLADRGTWAGQVGGSQRIIVEAPLIWARKAEIVRLARGLRVEIGQTVSCYNPARDNRPCGECDACLLRSHALGEE